MLIFGFPPMFFLSPLSASVSVYQLNVGEKHINNNDPLMVYCSTIDGHRGEAFAVGSYL
jgi:hypothetical protein